MSIQIFSIFLVFFSKLSLWGFLSPQEVWHLRQMTLRLEDLNNDTKPLDSNVSEEVLSGFLSLRPYEARLVEYQRVLRDTFEGLQKLFLAFSAQLEPSFQIFHDRLEKFRTIYASLGNIVQQTLKIDFSIQGLVNAGLAFCNGLKVLQNSKESLLHLQQMALALRKTYSSWAFCLDLWRVLIDDEAKILMDQIQENFQYLWAEAIWLFDALKPDVFADPYDLLQHSYERNGFVLEILED